MRKILILSLVALFAMAAAGDDTPEIGKVVADQTLKTLDGKTVKLSDYRNDKEGKGGKIVVLTFWSYKCPSGARLMEVNEELAKHCKEKDAIFIGVASYGESEEDVKKYCKKNDITYTIAHDGDQGIAKALGAEVVSETMVLDKDGKLAYTGALVTKDRKTKTVTPCTKSAVDELLAGKAVSEPKTLPSG